MGEKTKNNNGSKISWYLRMPVLVILFFIFPPVSSIFSIILFVKRWKISNPGNKKKTAVVLAVMCSVFVAFVIYGAACTISDNKKLNKINEAIDSGNYITAEQLIDEEYKDDYVSYSVVRAKSRMYEKQGLYNEAANTILEYWDKRSDKSGISDSTVNSLEGYKNNCDEETVKKIDILLEARRTAIEQKAAEEQAKVTAKQAEKDAKVQAKADKAAAKQAAKDAKAQAKADKAAAEQAAKDAKAQAKADKAAAEQAAKDAKAQAKADKAAAEQAAKDAKAQAKADKAAAEQAAKEQQSPTEKTAPTEEVIITPVPTAEAVSKSITSSQSALNAVKKYITEQGISKSYDKVDITEKADYFTIYTYCESKEQSGDFYEIYKDNGEVKFVGSVDDILTQGLWTDFSASYNDVAICTTEWNGINLISVVKNNTSNKIMADIDFKFYDANDIQIGTTSKLISEFEPSAKAKIELWYPTIPSGTARFEITNITVYDKYYQ